MADNQQLKGGLLASPTPQEARQDFRGNLFKVVANSQSPQGQIGASIGAGLGLAIRNLLGIDAPGEERARKMQKARKEIQDRVGGVQGLVEDPSGDRIKAAQDVFNQLGLTQEAQRLPLEVAQARQAQLQQRATQADINLTRAKTAAALQPDDPQEQTRIATGDSELGRQAGLKPGERAPVSFTRTQQDEFSITDVGERLGAGESPSSDLFDERGNIKNEVSNDLIGRAIENVGGTTYRDPNTGEIRIEATPQQRSRARTIAVRAENKIRRGEAISTTDALNQAMREVGRGKQGPRAEIGGENLPVQPLPQDTQDELLSQNQRISKILGELDQIEEEAGEATGVKSNLQAIWNNTVGQLSKGIPFEDAQKARQRIRQFNNRVVEALRTSGRITNQERERIEEFLPSPNSWFTDPDAAVSQINELGDFLERIRERNREDLGLQKQEQQPQESQQKTEPPKAEWRFNPQTGELERNQ